MPPARETSRALRRLQAAIRAADAPDARHGRSGQIPEDLATPNLLWLTLTGEESDAFGQAMGALEVDLCFEHLDRRSAYKLLWRLTCQAHIDRSTDHVDPFISAHARESRSFDVIFTVRHLDVHEEFELGGAMFLPTSSTRVPAPDELTADPDVRGILQTTAVGTDRHRIIQRARATAEQALRVLRNGLRTTLRGAPNRQLRFALGERYAFADSHRAGWQLADEAAWELRVDAEMAARVATTPTARLDAAAHTDLDTHANTAMRWADRSLITPDPLVRILYLFFALEALVGDRATGEKGRRISFRRAVLDHATRGGFRNPHITYALYDEVRSAAVHGGRPPDVSERDADALDADVRGALDQVLKFAAGFAETKHSRVMNALDRHPDAPEIVRWLQATDRGVWHGFTP